MGGTTADLVVAGVAAVPVLPRFVCFARSEPEPEQIAAPVFPRLGHGFPPGKFWQLKRPFSSRTSNVKQPRPDCLANLSLGLLGVPHTATSLSYLPLRLIGVLLLTALGFAKAKSDTWIILEGAV